MNKMYGITGLQIAKFHHQYAANEFIKLHDGNIVDIQVTTDTSGSQHDIHSDTTIVIVYTEKE